MVLVFSSFLRVFRQPLVSPRRKFLGCGKCFVLAYSVRRRDQKQSLRKSDANNRTTEDSAENKIRHYNTNARQQR